MIKRRTMTGLILGGLAIAALFSTVLFVIVATVLIGFGLYEYFRLIEKKQIEVYKYFGIMIGIIIPLSIFLRFELTKGWELLFISLALGTLFVLQFSRRQSVNAVLAISTTMFGIFYIAWFFSFLIKIKLLPQGTALVASLIFMTKGADIGAYLIGTRWGRRQLFPRISPKKTVEGLLGGLGSAIVIGLLCKFFLPDWPVFVWPNMILIATGVTILGLLGDFSESLIKRDCNAKDSSKILPGLGGVLDVIDSLLFTAPAYYFFMNYYLSRAFVSGTGF